MNGDGKNIWERPWNTDEIIQNSENWSLACDAALLNTIKSFANNLLTKTETLNDNINSLLHNLDEVGLKLDISQNEFQNLKNTQFIESRVYDDDEALDSKENEIDTSNDPQDKKEEIDPNLSAEFQLLDKYYELVEISISDSEDESEKSFVFQPKDLYGHRPLPPIIGSDEWYKNWYLDDQASDVDSQKSSEVYSESDSDDNLPNNLFNGSETSSELDFSRQTNDTRPVANSTFKDKLRKPQSATSSEGSDELGSLPSRAPISNQSFAEQLAAKLGNVISQEEVNTKPIHPPQPDPLAAALFADEPPPLNNFEDKTVKGIFSGGTNLFDDNAEDEDEDSILWDNQRKQSIPEAKQEGTYDFPKSSQVSRGLFDSDNSDDDLFAPKTHDIKKPAFLQPNKPTVPLFDDGPPSLDDEKKVQEPETKVQEPEKKVQEPEKKVQQPEKKKPIGGVSIFGGKNMGDILKKRQPNNNDNLEKSSADVSNKGISFNEDSDNFNSKPKIDKTVKKVSLFDELEQPDKPTSKSKKLSLFDDDDDDFFKEMNTKPKTKTINLFDDSLDNDNDKTENNNKINEKSDSNTQDAAKKNKLTSLFDDEDDDVFNRTKRKATSLFNDDDNENGSLRDDADLFNNDKIAEEVAKDKKNNNILEDFSKGDTVDNKIENTNTKNTDQFGDHVDIKPEEKESSRPEKIVDLFGSKSTEDSLFDNKKIEKSNYTSTDTEASIKDTKKISLFADDDDEDEDDIFSNVNKKLDFKLFEDPEGTDDLFSIKTPIVSEDKSLRIQKAEIKKTSDIQTEEIKIVDAINQSKEAKDQENNIIEEEKDLLKKNIPPKPEIASKPSLTQPEASRFSSTPPEETSKPTPDFSAAQTSSDNAHKPTSTPVVNLFGSTPPPDDDDWDTKSDLSETDDFVYSNDELNNRRSNLFDNEPPSLTGYESSGIIRDHSGSRVDTSEFSFNPHGHSSRRLSSDILNEQQSQDSFFVTKNKTGSASNQSHLDIVPEDSKITTIDVTPSGDLDESTDSSTPKKSDSVLSDNVFLNKSNADSIPEKTGEEKSGIEKGGNKIASITERLQNQGSTTSPEKKITPGKLKPSLNINVNALLPGLSQPRIKSLTKSQSEEEGDTKPTSSLGNKPSLDVTDSLDVLPSYTKERVRNPSRRPSTRRGRQQALRSSGVEGDETDNDPRKKDVKEAALKLPQSVFDNEYEEAKLDRREELFGKKGSTKIGDETDNDPRKKDVEAVLKLPQSVFDNESEEAKIDRGEELFGKKGSTKIGDETNNDPRKDVESVWKLPQSVFDNKSEEAKIDRGEELFGKKGSTKIGDETNNDPRKKDVEAVLKLPQSVFDNESEEAKIDRGEELFGKKGSTKIGDETNNDPRKEDVEAVWKLPQSVSDNESEEAKIDRGEELFGKKDAAKISLFGSDSETEKDDGNIFNPQEPYRIKSDADQDGLFATSKPEEDLKEDLFGSSKSDSDDLFGSSKLKTDITKDIFESKPGKTKETSKKDKGKSKKSLFEDSSSDEDLFSGNSKESKKQEITTRMADKKIKPVVKKLKNIETEDDPLSDLLK